MAKNRDGLEPGQRIDFETLMKLKRQQRERKNEQPEPRKTRGRKKAVRRSDEQPVEDSSGSASAEEA
jgi:hypothetical protein